MNPFFALFDEMPGRDRQLPRGTPRHLDGVRILKAGMGAVGAYFEVLRPMGKDGLDGTSPEIVAALQGLPPGGYISAGELEGRCGHDGARRALEWACRNGILHKTPQDSDVMDHESVRFWLTQLNPSRMKNFNLEKGTKRTYADSLEAFNRWLSGKRFPAGNGAQRSGGEHRTFQNVEDLLGVCYDPEHGTRTAKRVVREYLADLATSDHTLSTTMVRCAAVKSYFATHDVPVNVRVDRRRHVVHDVRDSPEMSLFDFYKMMTMGSMDMVMKAVMMIKFQAGLDSSTFADRFNFEAYPQIVRHFGIEDYEAWDFGRCPVPVRLVRVKTSMEYTTFIDRDAVSHLRDYLRWREFREGQKYDSSEPLFVTRRGVPVGPNWISRRFSKAAIDAGIQKRTSRRVYKIHSHEVRDLLKSTLLVSGCAQYAADHVLGHAPRDSYEKQATLYPEKLRSEYAKASGRLNIFSSIEKHLRATGVDSGDEASPGGDRYQRIEAQQQEMQATLRKVTGAMTDVFRIVASSREGSLDAVPDDMVRRLRGLEGDGEKGDV